MGQYTEGILTFKAGEALGERVRVKASSGTTTDPIEVVAAGAGEQHIGVTEYAVSSGDYVAVRPRTMPGSKLGVASEAFARGATLYGAASGKIKDTSAGSAIGIALEEATADGDIVEWMDFSVLSTTAATVSVADTGGFTATTDVEAALAEIYQHITTVQGFIPIPLYDLREVATMAVANAAGNGGVLASDTTPILEPINGATDGCQRLRWAASNSDVVAFSMPLPPDLDATGDVVLHTRIGSGGTTNAVGFTVDSWWNEGDTKVTDTSETNQTTTVAEKITTIAAADLPAVPQTVTIALTPVAHTTDTMLLTAVWIEYKRKVLTS